MQCGFAGEYVNCIKYTAHIGHLNCVCVCGFTGQFQICVSPSICAFMINGVAVWPSA